MAKRGCELTSGGVCEAAAVANIVLEHDAFYEAFDELALLWVQPGHGLEVEPQVLVGPPVALSEQQVVGGGV